MQIPMIATNKPIEYADLTQGFYSLQTFCYNGKWFVAAVNNDDWSQWAIVETASSEIDAEQIKTNLIKNYWTS